MLELRIALGFCDQQKMVAIAGSFKCAPDQVAGEWRRRNGVGDEPERVGGPGAQTPRDDVGPVAEILISSRRPVRTNDAAVGDTPARRATSARMTRFTVSIAGCLDDVVRLTSRFG